MRTDRCHRRGIKAIYQIFGQNRRVMCIKNLNISFLIFHFHVLSCLYVYSKNSRDRLEKFRQQHAHMYIMLLLRYESEAFLYKMVYHMSKHMPATETKFRKHMLRSKIFVPFFLVIKFNESNCMCLCYFEIINKSVGLIVKFLVKQSSAFL